MDAIPTHPPNDISQRDAARTDEVLSDTLMGNGALGDGAEVALRHVRSAPTVTLRGNDVPVPQLDDPTDVIRQGAPAGATPGHATLSGYACTACVWTEATRVQVRRSPRQIDEVVGTRSWRGRALFDNLPDALRDGGLWEYEGLITIEGDGQHVQAPVIVHTVRSINAEGSYVVEFAGAGNLPSSLRPTA